MTEIEETFLSIPPRKWDELLKTFMEHYDVLNDIMKELSESSPKGTFRCSFPYGYIIFKTGVL